MTTDPYVVYTSNICAILGLRSLYFILAEALENFEHIKYGLAAVLGFVAVKILIAPWFHVHAGVSLLIIIGILVLTAVLGGMIDDGACASHVALCLRTVVMTAERWLICARSNGLAGLTWLLRVVSIWRIALLACR